MASAARHVADEASTTSITIRGLRPETKTRARVAAARNGRSMEAEVRALLERSFGVAEPLAVELGAVEPGESWIDELIRLSPKLSEDEVEHLFGRDPTPWPDDQP